MTDLKSCSCSDCLCPCRWERFPIPEAHEVAEEYLEQVVLPCDDIASDLILTDPECSVFPTDPEWNSTVESISFVMIAVAVTLN